MKPSSACLNLVKHFEGFRAAAYRDAGGRWTIGYGHAIGVKPGAKVTKSEAQFILAADLASVARWFDVHLARQVKQCEYDALCSLAFNIGVGKLGKSALFRYVAAGQTDLAAAQFARWTRAGGKVLPGLFRRRLAERALFSTGRWST